MNPRNTMILALVVAALGAFLYFYEIRGQEERADAAEAAKRLFQGISTEEIDAIVLVSSGGESVRLERSEEGWRITEPVHFQVFVTPTCPYCPQAVRLAHKFAMESELITADMVEAVEFPQLANKYAVHGVPRTIINETVHQEGAAPEPLMLAKLLEAAGAAPADEHQQEHQH